MDPAKIFPRTRQDLQFYKQVLSNEVGWIVKDPVKKSYYWFDRFQAWLLQHFDGERSLVDLKDRFNNEFGTESVSEVDLIGFLHQSVQDNLVEQTATGQQMKLQARRPAFLDNLGKAQHLFAIRLPAFNASIFIETARRLLGFLMTRMAVISVLFLFCWSIVLLFQNSDRMISALSSGLPRAEYWLTLLVAISFTKIFHELGHAVCCRSKGAECTEIGMLFLFFSPCLYCDVSDSRILPKSTQRMSIMLAGVYFELLLASIAIICWVNSTSVLLGYLLINVAIVASISTLLVNLNPLVRFDGYYFLCELIGVRNLSSKSQAAVRNLWRRMLFHIRLANRKQLRRNSFFLDWLRLSIDA